MEFTADSKNYLGWKWGIEFEIVITEGGELNFDKSFLQLSKEKLYAKVTLNLTVNIEY